ncbi:MAG: hypothetical protein IBX52_04265 [Bacterioplanes sp.]|nr:hypothetical protein [Bacterioplanes sp.]
MALIVLMLTSFIIGASGVAWWLNRRWQNEVAQAQQTLADALQQHQQEQAESKALRQQVADLRFQLTRCENDLKAHKNS